MSSRFIQLTLHGGHIISNTEQFKADHFNDKNNLREKYITPPKIVGFWPFIFVN